MKIVVLGGSGLIGRKLVSRLQASGHEAIPASPSTGVNALTGDGLNPALQGAQVVVDVTNSPSFADQAVLEFFTRSTQNLLAAACRAGVRHYVALSIVGADRIPDSGYMRAKVAQEKLIQSASVPYTILRATQFVEFIEGITAQFPTDGQTVHVPTARIQPILSDEVVAALVDVCIAAPVNDIVDLAGPEPLCFEDLTRQFLAAIGDPRRAIADPDARYFGARLDDVSLVPVGQSRQGSVRFADWLLKSVAK